MNSKYRVEIPKPEDLTKRQYREALRMVNEAIEQDLPRNSFRPFWYRIRHQIRKPYRFLIGFRWVQNEG